MHKMIVMKIIANPRLFPVTFTYMEQALISILPNDIFAVFIRGFN